MKSANAEGIRLNKVLAQAGVASRRGADELVAAGRVAVNGVTVTEQGLKVLPGRDAVSVDGKPVPWGDPEAAPRPLYILLHKPVRVVSTARDPQGRPSVLDLLPQELRSSRLYPVGRLDYFSEGLILLTNDGELALRLTHPRYHLPKTYHVRVRETPSHAILERMRGGMTLAEGEKLAPVDVRLLSRAPDEREPGVVLELVLHQGINRQIRRMCRDFSLTILSLRRVASGPLLLGDLPKGASRPLTEKELSDLRRSVGLAAV